jgi:hypothetical protein
MTIEQNGETEVARMRRPDPDPTNATIALVKDSLNSFKEFVVQRFESMDRAQSLFHEDLVRVPTVLDRALAEAKEQNSLLFTQATEHSDFHYKINDERLHALADTVTVFKQTVNERFQLGDIQTEKAARDVKSAVDAAFAAAKEAVGEQNKSNALSITKSETAFTKQIDQLAESVKQIVKNTDDKISDLKERLIASEGKSSVTDPTVAHRLNEMSLTISQLSSGANVNSGKSQQFDVARNTSLAMGAIIISFVIGIGAIITTFLHH